MTETTRSAKIWVTPHEAHALIQHDNWLLTRKELTAEAKLLWRHIGKRIKPSGVVFVVPEEAALSVGVEAECCRRVLDELVTCGLVVVSECKSRAVRCRLTRHPWMPDAVFSCNADVTAKPALISVAPRSRYTLDECRRFAQYLKAAGENVCNVGGLARHFHSRAYRDNEIGEFLKRESAVATTKSSASADGHKLGCEGDEAGGDTKLEAMTEPQRVRRPQRTRDRSRKVLPAARGVNSVGRSDDL